MTVHPHANAFDSSADQYEQGRPGYPSALLDWIRSRGHLESNCTVVDLGAGTGKLTRLLIESSARVIAIEPIRAMREQFEIVLPDVEMLDATAEAMPLPDRSVDTITCGQSIRWFANEAALMEIARVLRVGGELIIIYNEPDKTNPLQQRMGEITKEVNTISKERKPGAQWRELFLASPHFELVGETVLPNPQTIDRARLSSRLYSSSQFARLPPPRQQQLIVEFEAMAEGDDIAFDQFTTVIALRKTGTD